MNSRQRTIRNNPSRLRSAFTLTEMLVATALVVLIMLMFAQIYGSAVGSIREQRGLSNNDQKARSLETTIRQDLQRMTFRQPAFPFGDVQGIVPLATDDDPIVDDVNQRGYFFYDENSVNSKLDDILQFTMQIRSGQRGDTTDRHNAGRFVGKAANLGIPNEPEEDDGISSNGLGSSRAAEVVYFLRGGNLYRRVLLLRDPKFNTFHENPQPTTGTERRRQYHTGNRNYAGTNYYDSFDYAAVRRNNVLWFHSIDSLNNDRELTNWPIAIPNHRFGFDPSDGNSVETHTGGRFNRFTMEETSNNNFLWPGQPPANNPYTRTDLDDTNDDDVIDQYADGNRVAEDILMTNVESFDVKAFDLSENSYVNYDEATTRFDTWHPHVSSQQPASLRPGSPGRQLFQTAAGTWMPGDASPPQFIPVPVLGSSGSMIYRLIRNGTTGDHRPELPPIPGTIVEDNGAAWECVDNRVPLKGISITIRFLDQGSRLPRQVTVVHSFVE